MTKVITKAKTDSVKTDFAKKRDCFNGKTTVFGVIGDPVSHSLSPQIHGYFAGLYDINMAYVPFHVESPKIQEAIKGAHALGIYGLNVTVPHKKAVMPYLDHIDPMAQKVGAVNTLVMSAKTGCTGYNTDYIGIQRTIAALGMSFEGSTVVVIGAGGSAYAACIAAAEGGAARIIIFNRTLENAVALASHVNSYYNVPIEAYENEVYENEVYENEVYENEAKKENGIYEDKVYKKNLRSDLPKFDIVIQTTTLGFGQLKGKSPVFPGFFKGVSLAFDIIYSPWETVFLRQAKEEHVPKIVNGFPMLVYQAAAAFDLWHERSILRDKNYDEDSDEDFNDHIKILQGFLQ